LKLSRKTGQKINWVLDQLIPPIIRDSRWFMPVAIRIMRGPKAALLLDYKQKVLTMSRKELVRTYRDFNSITFERDTDTTKESRDAILHNVVGKTILEVGAGNGFLVPLLMEKGTVTASDIDFAPSLIRRLPEVKFVRATMEALPFEDRSFDTVVCAHSIEHVPDLAKTMSELRRVTRRRLIIVTPQQRPYKYTFDLHVHFFPYPESLVMEIGPRRKNWCANVGGDLFYVEDMPSHH
jgi:ubiquinone/menaquinone biosynthesis C-methylase UbiE